MGNTFGDIFSVTSFGESHGVAVGCVIDGCPANISLNLEDIQNALDRRKPGQNELTTTRQEKDKLICLSGLSENKTLGSPLCFVVFNEDKNPKDYTEISAIFRPSHADYTYQAKYGIQTPSGGGRASARETIARVIAGSVAEQILKKKIPDLSVVAYVHSVGEVEMPETDMLITRETIDKSLVRCPDPVTSKSIQENLHIAKEAGDSLGGVITCIVRNCPVGLGEPVFDKLSAQLGKAILSIPACKGIEFGSGFHGSKMRGSYHNDPFIKEDTRIRTKTNHSGGIQGGISNGEDIYFKAAFKPVSTIFKAQQTVNRLGEACLFQLDKGRHDPCVVPRAVPIVEAMTFITLFDFFLKNLLQIKY